MTDNLPADDYDPTKPFERFAQARAELDNARKCLDIEDSPSAIISVVEAVETAMGILDEEIDELTARIEALE